MYPNIRRVVEACRQRDAEGFIQGIVMVAGIATRHECRKGEDELTMTGELGTEATPGMKLESLLAALNCVGTGEKKESQTLRKDVCQRGP